MGTHTQMVYRLDCAASKTGRDQIVAIDTGRIAITRWAIHEIPRVFSKSEDFELSLSEAESPQDAEVARFFEQKISDTFKRSRHQIQALEEASEVPSAINAHLSGDGQNLIDLSKTLAEQLVQVQSGAMSAGLLVVLTGQHEDKKILCVLKLEKEEGARAKTAKVEGKTTYSVEYMRDLFLTGKTRVFKIAIFLRDGDELEGWVSDPQSRGTDVAEFFLKAFLKCRLTIDSSVATRNFHSAAEKFINERVDNPETKVRYETALLAQLNSNKAEINLNDFVKDNLATKDRAPFIADMTEAGVHTSFVKDTKLISSTLRRLQYEFTQGAKVSYPIDMSDEIVNITARDDGQTQMQIVDQLKKLHTRG
jgi:hypothetical protein